MDIGSNNKGVAGRLSNFTPRPFKFDGVECISMEGFLQSIKFDKVHIQETVTMLTGIMAKKRGSTRNHHWQSRQQLWWKGIAYHRRSKEYQLLLDFAYEAIYNGNEQFKKDLHATHSALLTHSIGHNKQAETVLTEKEFCSRLMRLRNEGCLVYLPEELKNSNLPINELIPKIMEYKKKIQEKFIS
jgi:hypothetical protein